MGKKLVTERIVSVVVKNCYLTPEGAKHRIGMTNTGRTVLMDHSWEEVKLMREMVRPRCCCYDYVVGSTITGSAIERAFTLYRFKSVTQPVDKKPIAGITFMSVDYFAGLKVKAHQTVETAISLGGHSPYQGYMQVVLTYRSQYRSGSDGLTPAHDRKPCWNSVPHGRQSGGHMDIRYTMKMVVDIIKNPDTLGVKFAVDKVSRQDSYVLPATTPSYIREDQPYLLPIIMEHRTGDARVVTGLLVDPNMTALPRRIRWARAVITPAGITFMSIEDLGGS